MKTIRAGLHQTDAPALWHRLSGSASVPFVAPFAVLIILLAAGASYPVRTIAAALALAAFSRSVIRLRPSRTWASIFLGVAVFAVWIGPDLLWPGYRESWLFRNRLTGGGASISSVGGRDLWLLVFRTGGSALLVPIVEELFWRAWLMRRLISKDFNKIALVI
ncbi:MAG: hypothetical protein M1541_13180, partial [Acidobacteria bacterium]|nr:hypothetical protein [Acidobacteriota bacterium]